MACAVDHRLELRDAGGIARQPRVDRALRILGSAPCEELQPQLLEIAGKSGDQQAFPGIRRRDPRGIGLCPVEPERLSQMREGAGQHRLVERKALAEIGKPDRTVELEQPDHLDREVVRGTRGFELRGDAVALRARLLEQQRLGLAIEMRDPLGEPREHGTRHRAGRGHAQQIRDLRPRRHRHFVEQRDACGFGHRS